MNQKVAREEFQKFRDELSKMSRHYPVIESKVDSAYNKCKNMLDSLYRGQVHSFSMQLISLEYNKAAGRLNRLMDFVDNILDDIKLKERAGDTPKPFDTIFQTQIQKTIDAFKKENSKLNQENADLFEKYKELSGDFTKASDDFVELSGQYRDELDNSAILRKRSNTQRMWLFILSFCFFTYINSTYPALLELSFNWKWFLVAEGSFFIPFLIARYKQLPRWVIIALGIGLVIVLIMFLIKQPDWEKELNTVLWAFLGSLMFALISSFLKSKKIDI